MKCERGRWLATSACGMHPEWRVSKHAGGQDYGFATEGVWRSRNQHVARVGCHSNATERCSGIGSCLGVSGRVRSSDTGYGWQTSSSSVVSGVQIPCLFSGFRRRGASGELLAQGKVRLWCALLEMGALLSHAPMVGPMGGLPASEWREALQAGDYSNGRSDGQMLPHPLPSQTQAPELQPTRQGKPLRRHLCSPRHCFRVRHLAQPQVQAVSVCRHD